MVGKNKLHFKKLPGFFLKYIKQAKRVVKRSWVKNFFLSVQLENFFQRIKSKTNLGNDN